MTRRKLLAVCVALASAYGLAEIACRLLLPPASFAFDDIPLNRLSGLLVPHPTRGYAMAAHYSGSFARAGRQVELKTNALGLRETTLPEHPVRLVLAAGDSFTVGFGVEQREAWPAQAEQHLRRLCPGEPPVRVLNGAVSGYSLRQIRIAAAELSDELHPQLLVLGLYPGGYWRIRTPYVLNDGKLVMGSVAPHLVQGRKGTYFYSAYRRPSLRSFHVGIGRWSRFGWYLIGAPPALAKRLGHPPPADAASEDLRARRRLEPLLAELDALAESMESRRLELFVVLVHPQSEDGSFATSERVMNRIVATHLHQGGIRFLDALELLDAAAGGRPVMRLADDHHWTAKAHALIGKAVAEALADSNSNAAPATPLTID